LVREKLFYLVCVRRKGDFDERFDKTFFFFTDESCSTRSGTFTEFNFIKGHKLLKQKKKATPKYLPM